MSEARAGRIAADEALAVELVVDRDPMARAGALLEATLRRLAGESTNPIRLAIPGGSALAAVAMAGARLGELWGRLALTWVDERCVPLASPDSNRGEAIRRGLFSARVGPALVLPLFEDGDSPEAAVARASRRFDAELGAKLDVVVLGLGEDGHVASLFPGRAASGDARVAAVHDSPKSPRERITLTRTALATARQTFLVAAGEPKREALSRLLAGDPALPATGLPGLVVVTDLDLAPSKGPR